MAKTKFKDDDFGIPDEIELDSNDELINNDKDMNGMDDDIFRDDFNFDLGDGGAPPLRKDADLLKDLTDFSPFIKDKMNGWLGLRWDEQQKGYVKDVNIDPICNVRCAAWAVDYLKTYARNNNILTHISMEDYRNMVMDIIDVLWLDIGCRMEYFGIDCVEDLHRICVELEHAACLVLMGAGDGKYSDFLQKTTMRSESVQLSPFAGAQMPQQNAGGNPKLGMWQKIKRLARGG